MTTCKAGGFIRKNKDEYNLKYTLNSGMRIAISFFFKIPV